MMSFYRRKQKKLSLKSKAFLQHSIFYILSITPFYSIASLSNEKIKRISGTDVVRYALTVHGSKYLLQDRPGALNIWWPDLEKQKESLSPGTITIKGNTDCSSLYAASIAFKGIYKKPSEKGKSRTTTKELWSLTEDHSQNDEFTRFKLPQQLRSGRNQFYHGDAFLWRSKREERGHVFLYNGFDSMGRMSTVEARGTQAGNGKHIRNYPSIQKSQYTLLRSNRIQTSTVYSNTKVFSLDEMSESNLKNTSSSQPVSIKNSIREEPTSVSFLKEETLNPKLENENLSAKTLFTFQAFLDGESTDDETTENNSNIQELIDFSIQPTLSEIKSKYCDEIKGNQSGVVNYKVENSKNLVNLTSLARDFSLDLTQLMIVNPNIKSPRQPLKNTSVQLPLCTDIGFTEGEDFIKVKYGDNLESLSERFKLSFHDLWNWNKETLKGKTFLEIGQILWIKLF